MRVVSAAFSLLILSVWYLSVADSRSLLHVSPRQASQKGPDSSPTENLRNQASKNASDSAGISNTSFSTNNEVRTWPSPPSSSNSSQDLSDVDFAHSPGMPHIAKSTEAHPRDAYSGAQQRSVHSSRLPEKSPSTANMSRPLLSSPTTSHLNTSRYSVERPKREQKFNCRWIHDGPTQAEIIESCWNATEIGPGYRTIDISNIDYNSFLESKRIFQIRLHIKDIDLTVFRPRNVEEFSYVELKNNSALEIIDFPVALKASSIEIEDNPKLSMVNLGKMVKTTLYVTKCSSEADSFEVKADALESGWFEVDGNPKIKEINLPSLISSELYVLRNEQLEKISVPRMKEVESIDIYRNAKLPQIDFPELLEIKSAEFKENEKLREINFPKLSKIGTSSFKIKGNPSLHRIFVPNLEILTVDDAHFEISNNSQLMDITLGSGNLNFTVAPKMKYRTGPPSFEIFNNPALTRIDIPSVGDTEQIEYLKIFGNRNLTRASINVPDCKKKNCYIQPDYECYFKESISNLSQLDGCLNIYGTLKLNNFTRGSTKARIQNIQGNLIINGTFLTASELSFLQNTTIKGGAKIVNNWNLTKIEIGKVITDKEIEIYGNRNLKRNDIPIRCPKKSKCYIQDDNECMFDDSIDDLSILNGCKSIHGSLILNGTVFGSTKTQIHSIQKDVQIIDSNLPIENLRFLENATIGGDFVVTGSCSTKSEIMALSITSKSVKYESGDCHLNCTADDIIVHKQRNCVTVVGHLRLEVYAYSEEDVNIFKTIQKVTGSIVMNFVYPNTTDTPPLIFESLTEISTPDGGSSLELWNLQYSNEFVAPVLTTVKNPDRAFLTVKGNPFLKSLEECLRLQAKLSNRTFDPNDLIVTGVVTELIEIDEADLHFYDNQDSGSVEIALLTTFLVALIMAAVVYV